MRMGDAAVILMAVMALGTNDELGEEERERESWRFPIRGM